MCATEQKLDFRVDVMCRHEAKFLCVILAWTVNNLRSVSLPCLINTSQGAFLCLTFYRQLQHWQFTIACVPLPTGGPP